MTQESLEVILQRAKEGSTQHLSMLLARGREVGFENFMNRKQVWPFLLGIEKMNLRSSIYSWQGELDRNSSDYQQLQKDAERSLSTMKTFQNITKFHLQKRQRDVLKILDSFFGKNTGLKYIQGFHDVASIFLVIFGSSPGYYMMEKAGKTYFKDYLTQDIGKIGQQLSQLILELLVRKDSDFEGIFECFAEMNMLPFIISWVLTWFAHVFTSVKTIGRIWDYILCSGAHGIVYVTAGVILATKDQLLAECTQLDHASIQMYYQEKVKSDTLDINNALQFATQLEIAFTIESLNSYSQLDQNSMLRASNFQLHIDLHRRVRQYNKKMAQKRTVLKIAMTVGTLLLIVGGIYLKSGRKYLL